MNINIANANRPLTEMLTTMVTEITNDKDYVSITKEDNWFTVTCKYCNSHVTSDTPGEPKESVDDVAAQIRHKAECTFALAHCLLPNLNIVESSIVGTNDTETIQVSKELKDKILNHRHWAIIESNYFMIKCIYCNAIVSADEAVMPPPESVDHYVNSINHEPHCLHTLIKSKFG